MKKTISLILISTILSSCAGTGSEYDPIVDGHKDHSYHQNLSQCQELSKQREVFNGDVKNSALIGATTLGLASAAADAHGLTSAVTGGIAGGIVGGAIGLGVGVVKIFKDRQHIISRCMEGRGYKVVK